MNESPPTTQNGGRKDDGDSHRLIGMARNESKHTTHGDDKPKIIESGPEYIEDDDFESSNSRMARISKRIKEEDAKIREKKEARASARVELATPSPVAGTSSPPPPTGKQSICSTSYEDDDIQPGAVRIEGTKPRSQMTSYDSYRGSSSNIVNHPGKAKEDERNDVEPSQTSRNHDDPGKAKAERNQLRLSGAFEAHDSIQLPQPNLTSDAVNTKSSSVDGSRKIPSAKVDDNLDVAAPIVAELAPTEEDMEQRVADRLEAQIEERLTKQLEDRLEKEREHQVVAEAVELDPDKDCMCGFSRTTFLALAIIVLVIAIGVTVALSGPDEETPSPTMEPVPTSMPTSTPTIIATESPSESPSTPTRFQTLVKHIGQTIFGSSEYTIPAIDSPQYVALDWLANNDTLFVDLDTVPTQVLVERYAMSVLYFATGGLAASWDTSFLEPIPICDWDEALVCESGLMSGLFARK